MKNALHLLWIIPAAAFSCKNEPTDVPAEEDPFGLISKIEVEVFVDGATYQVDNKDGTGTDIITDSELFVEFTTLAGSSHFNEDELTYYTTFDNPPVLGKLLRGEMEATFSEDKYEVLFFVDQVREFESSLFGAVTQVFQVGNGSVPADSNYIDDYSGQAVYKYTLTGSDVCNPSLGGVEFNEDNDIHFKELTAVECTGRAYLHVFVYVPN